MASHSDITDRWVQRQVMGSDRNTYERYGWWQSSRVMYWGDRIYSYGEHFVMGEVFRNKDGSPRFVLMDGERYSVSTMQHQSHLRSSLRRHAPDVPVLTVPGPAMREAGIIRESIVPLDIKADGYEFTLQVSDSMPKGAELLSRRWIYWGKEHAYPDADREEMVWGLPGMYEQEIREIDGMFHYHTARHWLGDALFSAQCQVLDPKKRMRVTTPRRKFMSSFDRQESRPLYFLCELPRTAVTNFEEALEVLKPDAVKLAELAGRPVTRQGDMFAVPMPGLSRTILKKMGAEFSAKSKSVPLYGTAHTASAVATLPDGSQYARGTMYHVPRLVGDWRDPDHARRKMGDGVTWHLVVKNTVPVRK